MTAGNYNSTAFIEYDVLSIDVGTTTSFTASDPITVSLGADSAAFLTEVAMVQINELDNTRGYVARGGFSASGDNPLTCAGVTGGSITNTPGLAGIQSLGASHVDALFGNGGYLKISLVRINYHFHTDLLELPLTTTLVILDGL